MVEIVLNEEQAKLLTESPVAVCLKTSDGRLLALVHRGTIIRTPDDEEEFFQRMKERASLPTIRGRGATELLNRLQLAETAR